MPGLLRGVARTAVVAGTATAVSNNVSRRQAKRFAAEDQPTEAAAPEAPVAEATSSTDELTKLAELKDQGIITEEEFTAKKKQILGI
jgi:hypothetical protein